MPDSPFKPTHSFDQSAKIAATDQHVQAWLTRKFQTTELLSSDMGGIAEAARDVINVALEFGRKQYSQGPERLCAVLSASEREMALAVDGLRDWILVSKGLIARLFQVAEDLAPRLMAETGMRETGLGRRLTTLPPMHGGFTSALSSLLFTGALAFFVGHEIGHHLEGHLGLLGSHATGDIFELPRNIVEQALEVDADERGVIVSRQTMGLYLLQAIESREYSEAEKSEYHAVLAMLLSAGLFLCMAHLRPKAVSFKDRSDKSHPPGSLRVLLVSMYLTSSIKTIFKITEKYRRQVRMISLDMASEACVEPGTKAAALLKERRANRKGEPHGMRALGLRRAIFDLDLKHRARELLAVRQKLKSSLVRR